MLLYRYEKSADDRIETLREGKIWMSLPSSFNDPLDCQLRIVDKSEFSTFKEKRIKRAANVLYEEYGEDGQAWLLDDAIVAEIRNWAEGRSESKGKPHFLELIEQRIQKFGVQCFSELVDSPLMWSHYADVHKGFCIEYEYHPLDLAFSKKSEFAMSPAIYTSQLQEFHLNEVLFSPKEVAHKLFATKSQHWSYEKEQRLIYFPCTATVKECGQKVDLPQGLKVNSIILGINTDPETKETLRDVASEINVEFAQMQMNYKNYALTKVEIN
jgi:hypothetical protein